MKPYLDEHGSTIYVGDCLDVLAALPENSVDTIITDPPYGLGFMGKDWDSPGGTGDFPMRRTNARNTVNTGASRQGGRQRGCEDWAKRQARDMQAFQVWTTAWASAVLRVAKPGAMMLAFGGTRTFHRLTCGIEEAGWEIRDCINWMYGQGFPKSVDISKAMDKAAGAERQVIGTRRGGAAINVGGNNPRPWHERQAERGGEYDVTAPTTDLAREWSGWGTALKPSWEPIVVAMKPLDGTFVKNAETWGVAGLNIDGGRIGDSKEVPTSSATKGLAGLGVGWGLKGSPVGCAGMNPNIGRWPANVLLDEAAAELLDEATKDTVHGAGHARSGGSDTTSRKYNASSFMIPNPTCKMHRFGDTGGASRFFYTAKASKSDRGHGNNHPTVKPTDLLRYLCRLTATPTGGIILDPFAGSGTTLVAAREEGRPCIGIELDEAHCRIAASRLAEPPLFPIGGAA